MRKVAVAAVASAPVVGVALLARRQMREAKRWGRADAVLRGLEERYAAPCARSSTPLPSRCTPASHPRAAASSGRSSATSNPSPRDRGRGDDEWQGGVGNGRVLHA